MAKENLKMEWAMGGSEVAASGFEPLTKGL
jgi:hypothetical protein